VRAAKGRFSTQRRRSDTARLISNSLGTVSCWRALAQMSNTLPSAPRTKVEMKMRENVS